MDDDVFKFKQNLKSVLGIHSLNETRDFFKHNCFICERFHDEI